MFTCGRCKTTLAPDAFSPSQRKNGAWCRSCMADYYRRPFDRAERECESPRCSQRFAPKHPAQRFCSRNCKAVAHHYRVTAEQRTGRTCSACGVSIEHMRLDAKWCSESCQNRRPQAAAIKRRSRIRRYGITPEDFDALLAAQGGGCGVCGGQPGHHGWAIDHCHAGGQVRGILCESCNLGLGKFKDDPEVLRRAAEYIERSS